MKSSIDRQSWESLLQLRDAQGGPLIFSLCEFFFESTPQRLKTLRSGVLTNDPHIVKNEAHTLKGSSANLGALTFSQLCSALEGLAKAGALPAAGTALIEELDSEYRKLIPEMKSLLNEARGGIVAHPVTPLKPPEESLAGLRILVVDDDAFYRSILTRVAAQLGADSQVVTVSTYVAAVEAIRKSCQGDPAQKPFDMVIADLNLKTDATGIDVWKIFQVHLKNSAFLLISGTPIDEFLALVGNDNQEVPAYLPKPFRLDQARSMIEWLLKSRKEMAA